VSRVGGALDEICRHPPVVMTSYGAEVEQSVWLAAGLLLARTPPPSLVSRLARSSTEAVPQRERVGLARCYGGAGRDPQTALRFTAVQNLRRCMSGRAY
jgi:hypothetical protein